ncbi:MAG: FAD-dependent oxidoreductase [Clostridia bacterium]|nr:FAD-dependent oxidoreductase [Clostridia bacterium]
MSAFCTIIHETDFCVVGGGMAGLFAALSAARHGKKVVLMQDRPMLGGNASSEIRMWICGAHGENNRETGLLEEANLENHYRNPGKNYHIWDGVLYGMARQEKNLTLLLNCSCLDAEMDGAKIKSVTGWQTTTQRYHQVRAKIFADCSGDSILAPLTGADFRVGREAKSEFVETIPPDTADQKTMGMSCLIQARETERESTFIPPEWAEKITAEKLPHRMPDMENPQENYWYLELGGDRDSIGDTEELRDELVALAYGMWDYIKNEPAQKEKNKHWELDFVGMLPGKRESRRYMGPHILKEQDVRAGGKFDDIVAYGGWTMDDHHPAGFRTSEPPNIFHPAPAPYGIPYRCLYSRNIENLFFAGRNISVSHAAFSSIRVMATCALCGQAAGTAAALALDTGKNPGEIDVGVLQEMLMEDDCYLPGLIRPIGEITRQARLIATGENGEAIRDGVDRPRDGASHCWHGKRGDQIRYEFARPVQGKQIRLVFDSDLMRKTMPEMERKVNREMNANRFLKMEDTYPPKTLIRRYQIWGEFADGRKERLVTEENNYQRLRRYEIGAGRLVAIVFEPLETWGSEDFRLFALDVQGEYEKE